MTISEPLHARPFSWLQWLGWLLVLNLAWILLAAFGAWLGLRSYTLTAEGEVATGVVVELFEEDRTDATTDIYPVVEFTVDGETYSVRSQNNYRWWNRYTRFPLGREVEMRYDPQNPHNAEINSWLDVWGEPIIVFLLAAFAAVGVNAYMIFWLRRSRNPKT
jgi:hypothetical protein